MGAPACFFPDLHSSRWTDGLAERTGEASLSFLAGHSYLQVAYCRYDLFVPRCPVVLLVLMGERVSIRRRTRAEGYAFGCHFVALAPNKKAQPFRAALGSVVVGRVSEGALMATSSVGISIRPAG